MAVSATFFSAATVFLIIKGLEKKPKQPPSAASAPKDRMEHYAGPNFSFFPLKDPLHGSNH
jgi:hypothetical protein